LNVAFVHNRTAAASPWTRGHEAGRASMTDAVHWIGMGSDEEFEAVIRTGAPTIRIIKPYADEEKIFSMIRCAEKNGALAVDHFSPLLSYRKQKSHPCFFLYSRSRNRQ
ncbi:MAG: hypothetical protein IIW88_00730, partial [Clostridia bacterium]|nr:hypothetical protein [Clostridia bacterium]